MHSRYGGWGGGSISHVQLGWLIGPIPIGNIGMAHGFSLAGANVSFRFGVEQNDKLRECDDLKQNMVNLRTSVFTPITLPTWDRISQMANRIRSFKTAWGFLKADRKDAYKQLLLDRAYVNLTLVALRNHISCHWYAFVPRFFYSGPLSSYPL